MRSITAFHSTIFEGLDGFSRELPSTRWRYYRIYSADSAMLVFFFSGDETGITTPPCLAVPARGQQCRILLRIGGMQLCYERVPVEDGMATLYFGAKSATMFRELIAAGRLSIVLSANGRERLFTLVGTAYKDSVGQFARTVIEKDVWSMMTHDAITTADLWDQQCTAL